MDLPEPMGRPRSVHKPTEEEELGVRYGVITGVVNNNTIFYVLSKGYKFLLTGTSRNYGRNTPKVSDLIKFKAIKNEQKTDIEGKITFYKIYEEQPPMFRSELKNNKEGKPVTKVSCELTFDYRNERGLNVFYNKWIGEVVDAGGKIPSPRPNDVYQCAVQIVHKYEEDPNGTWIVIFLQYYPLSQLKGPYNGFLFYLPKSKTPVVWCREARKLLFVSLEVIAALGHENVGNWTLFHVTDSNEIGRMELMNREDIQTVVTDDEKFMSTLLCEYKGEERNNCAVWSNDMVGHVFDTHKVTNPHSGDRCVLWCQMDCSGGRGNDEWVVERVEKMERMQRNEEERVRRHERGEMEQRQERGGDVERVQRKRSERVEERHEDDHLNLANGQLRRMSSGSGSTSTSQKSLKKSTDCTDGSLEEGELSLEDICRKLFKIPAIRRLTLESDPKSYALLMERLSGYGI